MLSANKIIEGAFYAMEQAGVLVNDASTLYLLGKWPSSLVLAVLSLEELGKAELLLQRGIETATAGVAKSRDEVMAGVTRHQTKLRAGRGVTTVTASVGFWGDIPEPNTAENTALEEQLNAVQEIALKNAPNEAHDARMRALYVDLAEDEMWSKPKDTGPSDAYLMVSAASIEYGVRRRKFVTPVEKAVIQAVAQLGGLTPFLPEAPIINWPDH